MLHGIVDEIVREHVQLAAFQWTQRTTLSRARPPDAAVVADIDRRLRGNLDAIEIAGDAAWPFIIDQFEDFAEAGELFVAAYLAVARQAQRRIGQCLWMAHGAPESRAGLAGALAWFAPDVTALTIRRMLEAESAVQRAVALDVLAAHRADAGRRLAGFLADASPMVCASACAVAAAAGRADCSGAIARLAEAEEPDLRFAAAEALARLAGTAEAAVPLKTEVESGGPRAKEALRVLAETMPARDSRTYLGALLGKAETRPLAVRGIGMLGDPTDLDWLIERMREPATAVEAGNAFVELFPEAQAVEGLFREMPAVPETAYEADEFAGVDRYPDADRIEAWADAARSGDGPAG